MKRCWQIHSIGTRVEAGSQVDDHVDALPDLLLDEFVVCISACDPGPRCALAERHGFRDLVAALACEPSRERIAENGIGPFRFAGAVNGREERVSEMLRTRCSRELIPIAYLDFGHFPILRLAFLPKFRGSR